MVLILRNPLPINPPNHLIYLQQVFRGGAVNLTITLWLLHHWWTSELLIILINLHSRWKCEHASLYTPKTNQLSINVTVSMFPLFSENKTLLFKWKYKAFASASVWICHTHKLEFLSSLDEGQVDLFDAKNQTDGINSSAVVCGADSLFKQHLKRLWWELMFVRGSRAKKKKRREKQVKVAASPRGLQ